MVRVSTKLTPLIDPRLIIALAALVATLFYLMVSERAFRVGFPLDDAWIHLTYARNLVETGEWAFRPGQTSGGSTSPLWTLLLAIGYILNLAPLVWPYILGWVVLTLLGIYAEKTARNLLPRYKPRLPWVGLFFVIAWHLTWSAVSGMETLLHGYLIFVVLSMLIVDPRRYFALGLLAGLSVWVRPDGLTLLGPVLFTVLLVEKTTRSRGDALARILISFGALFVPYLLFNLSLTGNPLPSTFYAKQAEYQTSWLSLSLADRLTNYLWPILASPFLVLIPSAFAWLYKMVRTQNWGAIAGLFWFIGYIGIYFMRLPAYQHGRYLIPAFPVMYLWGLLGMIEMVSSQKLNQRIVLIWQSLLVILSLVFSYVAARQNAVDVYWIESEMVETAQWVQENIAPDTLLAVHDIGALGYFAPNPILDLAGLITPEVVPFIRDQERLAIYLDEQNVEYLVTLPSFYPQLVAQREVVYSAEGSCAPALGEENMCVFRWK